MTALRSIATWRGRRRFAPLAAALVAALWSAAALGQLAPTQPPGAFAPAVPGAAFPMAPAANVQWATGPRGPVQFLLGSNPAEVVLPVTANKPGFSRRSGLQLHVDASWPRQFGYWPVDVTVRTSAPANTDQTITIRFKAGDYWNSGKSITAEQSFVLRQGATSASTRILAPQYQEWQTFGWRLLVDGQVDDLLTIDQIDFSQLDANRTNMCVATVGLSSSQASVTDTALQLAYSGNAVSVRPLAFDELSTQWIEYTTLDLVIMDAAGLAALVDEHPPQAAALLRWIRAGGNLWLIEAGDSWQRLAAVEQALGAAPRAASASTASEQDDDEERLLSRGWRYAPITERAGEPVEAALVLSGFELSQESNARRSLNDSRDYFVVRGHGLGLVAAFPEQLLSGGDIIDSRAMITLGQSLVAPRITWSQRHGNQPDDLNGDFNALLIPNVGVAPVGQFQILITLFVLGIGPLNYWLFRRRNKLPMLLATVPAAAAVTTALLFVYGVFADGVGVRTRARTLTLLDQRQGEAASWGRLSYYAGISPRGGLSVPADQAMYPVNPPWAVRYRYGSRAARQSRDVVWREGQQLVKGWLPSRTPTQYLAVAARPTSKKLELRTTNDGLRVVNRLGSDITHLAAVDHRGRMYWCENLPRDAGRVVPTATQRDVAIRIRRLFTENLPEAPAGADAVYSGDYYGFATSQSVMEGRLEAINSPQIASWGRGKYIAFTKEAIELDLGLGPDAPAGETSFHVVEGSW